MYAEIEAVKTCLPEITLKQYGRGCFIYEKPTDEDIEAAIEGLKEIDKIIQSEKYNVIILDEANIAVYFNLFTVNALIEVLQSKPSHTEVIVTGRYARPELIEMADLVTEMNEVKHYYTEGIEARKGIGQIPIPNNKNTSA